MITKYISGLAIAAALLIGQPAFAHDGHKGGGGGHRGHAVAAVHRSGGGGSRSRVAAVRTGGKSFAARRNAGGRSFAAARNGGRSRSTMAFGGKSNQSYGSGRGGRGQYAFASHSGWDTGREYYWRGHHYRWYDNGWFIIDPFPYYTGGYYYDGGYGDPVSAKVQAELARDGYYQGPIRRRGGAWHACGYSRLPAG